MGESSWIQFLYIIKVVLRELNRLVGCRYKFKFWANCTSHLFSLFLARDDFFQFLQDILVLKGRGEKDKKKKKVIFFFSLFLVAFPSLKDFSPFLEIQDINVVYLRWCEQFDGAFSLKGYATILHFVRSTLFYLSKAYFLSVRKRQVKDFSPMCSTCVACCVLFSCVESLQWDSLKPLLIVQ